MEKKEGYDFWKTTLNSAKFVVAPMVDASELPWRMLSRRYGAELCYTPMLHASVFIRDPNYRKESLASCSEDRPLIVQFCANDPATLLKAARYAENCCDAIDLNLGCPQQIARKGHYGAFLQEEWELLHKIISLCASELKVPITAKIRIFEDIERTVEYAKMLETAGVQLLTVHGRTKEKKGRQTGVASWKHIKAVKENVKIPVFANGNIQFLADVHKCIEETGVDGVMTAEGNLHNPGLFDGRDHKIWDMATEYLELVEKYPCPLSYIRGHVFKILHHALERHKHVREKLAGSKTIAHVQESVMLIQQCCKDYVEMYEKDPASIPVPDGLYRPYWICQPYVRPSEDESVDSVRKKVRDREQEFEHLKRTIGLDFSTEEELSRNQLKKIKRTHRRVVAKQNYAREKYAKCGCGNPKGQRCVFNCCKTCCKDKAFREVMDCPGHKLLVKTNMEWRQKKCAEEKEKEVLVQDSIESSQTEKIGPDSNNSSTNHSVEKIRPTSLETCDNNSGACCDIKNSNDEAFLDTIVDKANCDN